MAAMPDRSEDLFGRASAVIPGGVNSPVRAFGAVGGTPSFIARGSGAVLEDVDGRRFVDYVQSWGALLFGHAREEIIRAAIQAAERGTSFGAPNEAEVELAERIVEMVPGIAMVRLVSSGTEAAMSAVRLARAATGRDAIVKFDGCYHGHSDPLLAGAGSGVATFVIPGSPGVTEGAARDTLVLPYNDLEAVQSVFGEPDRGIGAVIVEPVAANMGVVAPADGFLEGLRALCDRNQALLIFDEVITGFRLAAGGAQEFFGVTPDITCLGKVMGGGFPCAAFGGRAELMELLSPAGDVYQAGTLSGNPVAVAAGSAALDLIVELDPYKDLESAAVRLTEQLGSMLAAAGIPISIPRVASLFSVFLREDPVTNLAEAREADHDLYARFFHAMLEEGVYLPPSGFEAWFLSTAHAEPEIDRTLQAAERAVRRLG
jgi:glutamate-1-semialdehyde 2,1-aminomutase